MKRKGYIAAIIVFAVIFIICVGMIIKRNSVRDSAEEKMTGLRETVEETDVAVAAPEITKKPEVVATQEPTEVPAEPESDEPVEEEVQYVLEVEIPDLQLDWEKLEKENDDIYAWIYIPNTKVDYPVLQHDTDDSYYLKYNIDGTKGYPGCIYTEKKNEKDFSDRNTVLYGHNMKNGTMFASLHKFEDNVFFEENKYIFIYTPQKTFVYEIFGAYEFSDKHLLYNYDYETDEGFEEYLEEIKGIRGMNAHMRSVKLNTDSKIVTLCTCIKGKDNKRYLVQGVLQYVQE